MTSSIPSDRDQVLREILVSKATSEGPLSPQRPRRIAIAVGAFILAGALTGAAITTTALASADQANKIYRLGAEAKQRTKSLGALVGEPVIQDAAGDIRLQLSSAQPSATRIVVAYECFASSSVVVAVARDSETIDCAANTPGVVELQAPHARLQTVTVKGNPDTRIMAWASWLRDRPVPEPSAQQELELSDGLVTHDEYLSAYNRYAGCMAEAGYPMAPITGEPSFVSYAVPTAAVDSGADSACYNREFGKVDVAWQLTLGSINTTCLAAHGIDGSKMSLQEQQAELRRAGLSSQSCSPEQW